MARRRRTVLKLMGEGCTGANGGDGGEGDNKTTGWDQKGDRGGGGGKSREGEWKGEGSQFREINKKIRALMNDHDNRAGGGNNSSTGAAGDNSKPTRLYSERQPAQKLKITPRDPRGISIVGGRGLGKFPEKNGGGGDNGTGARRFSTKVVPISEIPPTRSCVSQQESEGGGGGSSVNETSQNVSTASTISSRSSGSMSPEDGRWTVITGVGARGSSGGSSGRSKPPMPSGPPPTNVRGVRTAKLVGGGGGGGGGGGTGDHGTLSDTASSDEKDNVRGHWKSRSRVVARRAGNEASRGSGARRSKQHRYSAGGNGGGDGGGRHGSFSHRGARKGAGAAGGRRDRNDFESLDDVSSSEERPCNAK
ncbi:unnamed protein product [Ectocarpus sp. CCAP 1310/34]|nr:unnamed protein product [Ectocarpus sp. CCAP 1310/34]